MNTEYPDPTPTDLEDPVFNCIWESIKHWDLSRSVEDKSFGHSNWVSREGRLYAGAIGNDVMHILNALRHTGVLKGPYEQPTAAFDRFQSYVRLLEAVVEFRSPTVLEMLRQMR